MDQGLHTYSIFVFEQMEFVRIQFLSMSAKFIDYCFTRCEKCTGEPMGCFFNVLNIPILWRNKYDMTKLMGNAISLAVSRNPILYDNDRDRIIGI